MSLVKGKYNLRQHSETKIKAKEPTKPRKMATTTPAVVRKKPRTPDLTQIPPKGDPVTSESPPGTKDNKTPNSENTPVLAAIADLKLMFSGLTQQVAQVNMKLDNVSLELNTIKRELALTKKTVTDLEESTTLAHKEITLIEKEVIPKIKDEITKNKDEMETKLTMLEIHERKQNLLCYGIPQSGSENIFKVVEDILCHFLEITPEEAAGIHIVNAHRIPTTNRSNDAPEPIIIRFVKMPDRDRLLHAFERRSRQPKSNQPPIIASSTDTTPSTTASSSTTNTKFSRVTIRTDLPPALKRERGRLAGIAYKLRKEKKVSTRIKLIGSMVYLQTKTTSTNGNLQQTPWTNWKDTSN